MRSPLLVTVPLIALLAACGSSGEAGAASEDIAITAGDTTCDVAKTSLSAGKHTFDVTNKGNDVTEVYVYGRSSSDGDFDKVIGEVENIAPQTSRDFPVTLSGGEYEIACKPGQQGDGIRTKLTVSGAAAEAEEAKYDREVEVTAKEYAFTGLAGFTAKAGEKIEFKLENKGTMQHELEILGPDGKNIGEVGPTDAGEDGEVVIELKAAGTYTYLCGIADHATRGMKGTFTVS